MWTYGKRLQFPVNTTRTCPKMASLIISRFDGPDGELAAPMRYLSQRYTTPCKEAEGPFTNIGTEELGHLEIICAMIYQLTKNLTPEQAKAAGFDAYCIDRTTTLWPTAATGAPFNAHEFQSKGDVITDLHEGLAAEQKARTTYDNLIRIIENPEVREPLKLLRAREVVRFRRFDKALERIKSGLDEKSFCYYNAEFGRQFVGKWQNESLRLQKWGREDFFGGREAGWMKLWYNLDNSYHGGHGMDRKRHR